MRARKQKLVIVLSTVAALFFFTSLSAQAALVTDTFSWDVTFAAAGNSYGLTGPVGGNPTSWITGSTTYDDALIGNTFANQVHSYDDPGLSMTINFGTGVFTEADDDFGDAFLTFAAGQLAGVTLSNNLFGFSGIQSNAGTVFLVTDLTPNPDVLLVRGENFQSPSAVVPLPGAFWLFGSGLVGLIGFGRKKENR